MFAEIFQKQELETWDCGGGDEGWLDQLLKLHLH